MNKLLRIISIYPFCTSHMYHEDLFELYLSKPKVGDTLERIHSLMNTTPSVEEKEPEYIFVPFGLSFRRAMTVADIPFVTVYPEIHSVSDNNRFIGNSFKHYVSYIHDSDSMNVFMREFADWVKHNNEQSIISKTYPYRAYTGIGTIRCGVEDTIEIGEYLQLTMKNNIFPHIEKKYEKYINRVNKREELRKSIPNN